MKEEDFKNMLHDHPVPWRYATSRYSHHLMDADMNKIVTFDASKITLWMGVAYAVNKAYAEKKAHQHSQEKS